MYRWLAPNPPAVEFIKSRRATRKRVARMQQSMTANRSALRPAGCTSAQAPGPHPPEIGTPE